MTAASFDGDLKKQGGGTDGVNGADLLCAAAATKAGLDGTWIAWVSSSSVNAISRLPSEGHWTLIDKTTTVFASKSSIQLGPKHAIDMTEVGNSLPLGGKESGVWTATDHFGAYTTAVGTDGCSGWASQNATSIVGLLFDPKIGGAGLSWTDTHNPSPCGETHHLYCFEP